MLTNSLPKMMTAAALAAGIGHLALFALIVRAAAAGVPVFVAGLLLVLPLMGLALVVHQLWRTTSIAAVSATTEESTR